MTFSTRRRVANVIRTDYERIGQGYAGRRVADGCVAAQIHAALGDARSVLNVGAGTGNYEPAGRTIAAIDPSPLMLTQRPSGAAPAICAVAEHLPFRDGAFDAAMATLTLHHWRDLEAGLAEMRRVSRRQVVMLFDTLRTYEAWVVEYYPEMLTLPSEQRAPNAQLVAELLGGARIEVLPVPCDCTDGFGGAFWARPEAYLDPSVQAGMSSFAQLGPAVIAAGNARLAAALDSGEWDERFGHLRTRDEFDCGYRLVIAG